MIDTIAALDAERLSFQQELDALLNLCNFAAKTIVDHKGLRMVN